MKFPFFLAVMISLFLAEAARAADPAIGWISTWQQALSEARLSNKPILLMAGAPACGGVPGIW